MKVHHLVAAAAAAIIVSTSAQALTYATSVFAERGTNSGGFGDRNDALNALGAPNAVRSGSGAGGFFSLGLGKWADFTFNGLTFNSQDGIVFEVTFGNVSNHPESANIFAFLAGDGAPGSNDNNLASFVGSVPNVDAQSGFLFNTTSEFDTIRIWDTTASSNNSKGFDVDAVGVVPLPAAAWLLLGVSGALVAAKRRAANKAAA